MAKRTEQQAMASFELALSEYANAQNALTDAIAARVYPSKLATVVYRFATGCMQLGKAKLAADVASGSDFDLRYSDSRQIMWERAWEQAENATDAFLQVQERIDKIRGAG